MAGWSGLTSRARGVPPWGPPPPPECRRWERWPRPREERERPMRKESLKRESGRSGEDLSTDALGFRRQLLEGAGVSNHVVGAAPLLVERELVRFAARHLLLAPAARGAGPPRARRGIAFDEDDPVAPSEEVGLEEEG